MNSPFEATELIEPSGLEKTPHQQLKRNAWIEVFNLFATRPIETITRQDIQAIGEKYHANIEKDFEGDALDAYKTYVEAALADKTEYSKARAIANRMKELLGIKQDKADEIYNNLAQKQLSEFVAEAFSDENLAENTLELVTAYATAIDLPFEAGAPIVNEHRLQKLDAFLEKAIEDGRLSPEEDAKFINITKLLKLELVAKQQLALDKLRLVWKVENQPLEPIRADIILPKSEPCYFMYEADWYNNTVEDTDEEDSDEDSEEEDAEIEYVDTGTVYITGKRLIFNGEDNNFSAPLTQVIDITEYSDGVDLTIIGLPSIYLEMKNADLFTAVLKHAIADS